MPLYSMGSNLYFLKEKQKFKKEKNGVSILEYRMFRGEFL